MPLIRFSGIERKERKTRPEPGSLVVQDRVFRYTARNGVFSAAIAASGCTARS